MRVVEKFQPGLAVGLGLPGGVLARGGFVVGDLAFSAVLARQRTAGVLVQPGLAIDAQPPPRVVCISVLSQVTCVARCSPFARRGLARIASQTASRVAVVSRSVLALFAFLAILSLDGAVLSGAARRALGAAL